jgi:hypothetical protein
MIGVLDPLSSSFTSPGRGTATVVDSRNKKIMRIMKNLVIVQKCVLPAIHIKNRIHPNLHC